MLALPFKLNQAGRHHIPRQKHNVTNWPAYDASLRQRGSLTVWFSDEAIAAWKAERRRVNEAFDNTLSTRLNDKLEHVQ